MGQSQHRISKNTALPASDADIQDERVVKQFGSGARWHNKDPGGVEKAVETSGVDFFSLADRERCPSVSQRDRKSMAQCTERPWSYEIMSADV